MRNFIKNRTPEWWDSWCTVAAFMVAWSVGWIIVGFGDNFNTGFMVGMLFYWVGILGHTWIVWMGADSLRIYRELNVLNTKIIARQRETIAIKNETIKVQKDHINHLQEQLALKDIARQVERWNR